MVKLFSVLVLFVFVCYAGLNCVAYPSVDSWYDSYGDIPWEQEALHLDNFAFDLRRSANNIGYVALYFKKDEGSDKVKARITLVREYLICARGVEKNRIIVINAGRKDKRWTILQPVVKDLPAPDFTQ